jgi:hypothetical protein
MFKPSSKYYSWPAPQIPSGTPPGLWTIPKPVLAEWVRMARMPKIQGHALSTYGNCKAISAKTSCQCHACPCHAHAMSMPCPALPCPCFPMPSGSSSNSSSMVVVVVIVVVVIVVLIVVVVVVVIVVEVIV